MQGTDKKMRLLERWSFWTFTFIAISASLLQSPSSAQSTNLSFIEKDKRYDIIGDLPTLCVVNNNTVLQFSSTGQKMVYSVYTIKQDGSINAIALENDHGSSHKYNTSYIAVHPVSNTIIKVAQGVHPYIYYRTGVLNGGLIDWYIADGIMFTNGKNPSVVVTDSGTVASVYEGIESGTPSLNYKLGYFDSKTNKIKWYTSITYAYGNSPKIAVTNDGIFIEVHCLADKGLYYTTGKLDDSKERINWLQEPVLYRSCQCNSIDLMVDPFDIIVESHNEGDNLYYTTGKLQGSTIEWASPTQYSTGSNVNPGITFLPRHNHIYVLSYTVKDYSYTELSINTLAFGVELSNIEYGKPVKQEAVPFAKKVTEFKNNGPVSLKQTWTLEQQYICTNTYNWESKVHHGISVTAMVKFFPFKDPTAREVSIDLTVGDSSSVSKLLKWTTEEMISIPANSGKVSYTATFYRTPVSIPYTATFNRGNTTWTETGTVQVTHGAIAVQVEHVG